MIEFVIAASCTFVGFILGVVFMVMVYRTSGEYEVRVARILREYHAMCEEGQYSDVERSKRSTG